ncbi:sensor histidine kinase [Klenkia brasiliensis]|uniref:histidine kinase n=1 Tax=Klenkia brasiliensis TaxID=333142 RepID=A0A1G7QPX9_9ACTN|nr:HAMP domain-containing sensor histidine kinase [Klenkia brasiliensis]SDG00575.1 two-component system, OmpR family, sensor kinase [Klenkia brasiliensis]
MTTTATGGEQASPPVRPSGSSAGRPGAGRARTRVPLRVRLVALLVLLVALALAVTGVAGTSMLRSYLIEQQREQLQDRVQSLLQQPQETAQYCQSPFRPAGPELLACSVSDDSWVVVNGGNQSESNLPQLGAVNPGTISQYDDAPFTLDARDGSTSWLMLASSLPSGQVVAVGLDLSGDQATLGHLVVVEVVVGLVVLVLLGVTGYVLVRTSLRPLVEVEHTAAAIAAGDLSQRVPEGDDRTEVGRLARAFNGMVGRIEGAFRAQAASEEQARASEGRMRRFVADASHELRTPLTSIRGFAELYRQGAYADPAETHRMMGRIESEASRMGALVEDLLQLARLDQQRPVAALPVDLGELADDAVHDARAVAPDRPITLDMHDSLTEVPVVLGDEGRLRQVLANLVTNALTHTPAGTPVTVRVAEDPADPDVVLVAVADEGPGLSPEDAERVFERFYRADASRARVAGGSGLGLSIVSSLVAAHHGTVTLTTAPGQGATFTVRLPRTGPTGQG